MLLPDSKKLHPEFDLAAARQVFTATHSDITLRGEQITSPFDLYSVEALRDRHSIRIGLSVPTDVFVFGKGESPRRDGTKVGGIPYWPANRPWPNNRKGEPFLFLAQFNFADSRDLFPNLPGDVLLLLVENAEDLFAEDNDIFFEWLPLGLSSMAQSEMPLTAVKGGPFYGVIRRSNDYPVDAKGRRHPFRRPVAEWTQALNIPNEIDLPVLNGTKIGGVPMFLQSDDDFEGEFLCQLGSIQAAPDVPYPWVNREKPLSYEMGDEDGIYAESNAEVFGDMGTIYVFLHRDGAMSARFECY